MSQRNRIPRKGNPPMTGLSATHPARKFDDLLDSWRHEVTIPDDPEFADRLMVHLNGARAGSVPVRQLLALTSIAALLAVTAGLTLGHLLYSAPSSAPAEDELYTAADELSINTIANNPYDYLITEPVE